MEEDISIILQAGTMTMHVLKAMISGGIKTAALIKALHVKCSLRGQVPLKLLQKQGDTQAFRIPNEYLADFHAGAAKIKMYYSVVTDNDPLNATIVVRQADVGNFNFVTENIGVVENDIKKAELTGKEQDEGLITGKDAGKDYFSFELNKEQSALFQNAANMQSVRYISSKELGAATDYLRDNEMLKSSFDALVEKNRDNSFEATAIYEKYWPQLKQHTDIEVVVLDCDTYESFKANNNGISYAAAASKDKVMLAYTAQDRMTVCELTGADNPKSLVDKSTLNERMKQAMEEQPDKLTYIVLGDDKEKVKDICGSIGIENPVQFEKIAHSEKFYEKLEHRIARVQEKYKAKSETEKMRQAIQQVAQGKDR